VKMTPKESPKLTHRVSDRPFAEPEKPRVGDRFLRSQALAAPIAKLALGSIASSSMPSSSMPSSPELAPALNFKRTAPTSAAQSPYLVHWLQSGGNLDFCVLALCSCVLTVLCHQTTLSASPMASATGATPASAVQPAQIDFALKAGLFTTSPKIEAESESD
jgi:hypothetical protein